MNQTRRVILFLITAALFLFFISEYAGLSDAAKDGEEDESIDISLRQLETASQQKKKPEDVPTEYPTAKVKTDRPTKQPTLYPTERLPTLYPTERLPTQFPTEIDATAFPTNSPTPYPIEGLPTQYPTEKIPTSYPTRRTPPTLMPTIPTSSPSLDVTRSPTKSPTEQRPNIILILADDVGYYDVGANGNSVVQTPYLDKLRTESVRLEDFHMYPTCAASRTALLTGRYATRSGVWHTIMFRNVINPQDKTLPEILRDNGWYTHLIGKWHLGDNYPSRAIDKGFQSYYGFPGGGIAQTPDYWGNNNFNPTFYRDGVPLQQTGFSTDVFFDEAISKISTLPQPFFIYLALNAAHAPQNAPVDDKAFYTKYPLAQMFYGMVTNMDKNIRRLDEALVNTNLRWNTIFIFTTDNGSACGPERCPWSSRGQSGFKSSVYDGGHKVPFFIRWPKANIGNKAVNVLLTGMDVLPTLLELAKIPYNPTPARALDGRSFKTLLYPTTGTSEDDDTDVSAVKNIFNQRMLVIEDQRVFTPEKWRATVVLHNKWRYIKPKLFDLSTDPYQEVNVASKNRDIVNMLDNFYESYWAEMSSKYLNSIQYIALGSSYENPVKMNAMDWIAATIPPWDQDMITNEEGARFGFWQVRILEEGVYSITARKYPEESKKPINSGTLKIDSAVFDYGGVRYREKVGVNSDSVTFDNIILLPGDIKFFVGFQTQGTTVVNAYYVSVKRFTSSPTTSSPTIPAPTISPTTRSPTRRPTDKPTTQQPGTNSPSFSPSAKPTSKSPTKVPTTGIPTPKPTTLSPTFNPTTLSPTTLKPSQAPVTYSPSSSPTLTPSKNPVTASPTTISPTFSPTTSKPTTATPTQKPVTNSPTTRSPTEKPTTDSPTTKSPTEEPTTRSPTEKPTTKNPTQKPVTDAPTTKSPTEEPSKAPITTPPTKTPSQAPYTKSPTLSPTSAPSTGVPSHSPSLKPSSHPTKTPSLTQLTESPTLSELTVAPSMSPERLRNETSFTDSPTSTPQNTLNDTEYDNYYN